MKFISPTSASPFYLRARERFSFHVPSLNGKRSQIYFRAYDKPSKRTMYFRVKKISEVFDLFLRVSGLHIRSSYEKWVFGYRQLTKDETSTKSENFYALRTNIQRLEIFLRILENALSNKNPKLSKCETNVRNDFSGGFRKTTASSMTFGLSRGRTLKRRANKYSQTPFKSTLSTRSTSSSITFTFFSCATEDLWLPRTRRSLVAVRNFIIFQTERETARLDTGRREINRA